MKSFLIVALVAVCGIVDAAPQGTYYDPPDQEDDDHFLDQTNPNKIFCMTPDNREGFCVEFLMCLDDLTIAKGGIIDDFSLRSGGCDSDNLWCCVLSNTTETGPEPTGPPPPPTLPPATLPPATLPPPTPPPQDCRTGQKDSCPWCISIYRTKPSTGAQELFCGGAVVGPRLVLTSASCAQAFDRTDLWARLPGSTTMYKANNYTAHDHYKSGTKEHDVAFLGLVEDIKWPGGQRDGLGACLGLETPLKGDCVAVNVESSNELKFIPMTVTPNSCSARGSAPDAACGRATDRPRMGSPVLCPSTNNDFILAGFVRPSAIQPGSTLLGSLMGSADWITEQLKKFTS